MRESCAMGSCPTDRRQDATGGVAKLSEVLDRNILGANTNALGDPLAGSHQVVGSTAGR